MNLEVIKNYKTASDIEYVCGVADSLKLGILASTPLYSYIITNLYEVLDQDEDTLVNLYEKCLKIKAKSDKLIKDEGIDNIYLSDLFEEYFETLDIPYQNRVSLSLICMAFISWKSDLLDMDSYYEIRDMFVPFGMNITEDTIDVNTLFDSFIKYLADNKKSLRLLTKVGKTVIYNEKIEDQLIKDAFNEIYFDETAND